MNKTETEARLEQAESLLSDLMNALSRRGWTTATALPEYVAAEQFLNPDEEDVPTTFGEQEAAPDQKVPADLADALENSGE